MPVTAAAYSTVSLLEEEEEEEKEEEGLQGVFKWLRCNGHQLEQRCCKQLSSDCHY
jgi:hypothetical protein